MRPACIVVLVLCLAPPGAAATAVDFTLRSNQGTVVQLRDWRGSVAPLYFGYTPCPDACPTTLAEFAQVRQHLGAAAQHLRIVLVTGDSERDTPTRLYIYTLAPSTPTSSG